MQRLLKGDRDESSGRGNDEEAGGEHRQREHGGERRDGGEAVLGGRALRVRYEWKDITPSSARWEQSFSFDEGRSFETNWIAELTRR